MYQKQFGTGQDDDQTQSNSKVDNSDFRKWLLTISILIIGIVIFGVITIFFLAQGDSLPNRPTPTPESEVLTPAPMPTFDPRAEQLRQEIEELETLIGELTIERDRLSSDKDAVDSEVIELNEQITQATTERDSLQTQLETIDAEIASLGAAISGRQVVLQDAQMQVASTTPGYFAGVLSQIGAQRILFEGLSDEYLTLADGNDQLVEVGLDLTYCDMTIRFEFKPEYAVNLNYVDIRSENLNYGSDRVSDGGVFNFHALYIINESQISEQVVDQTTQLPEGTTERTRYFLLMNIHHNGVYCDETGQFLPNGFSEWVGFANTNNAKEGRSYRIGTVPMLEDLRGQ